MATARAALNFGRVWDVERIQANGTAQRIVNPGTKLPRLAIACRTRKGQLMTANCATRRGLAHCL